MKFISGLVCAILLVVLGAATEAKAITYYLGNSSPAAVAGVYIQTSCGPFGPYNLPAGTVTPVAIPAVCTVTGIIYQMMFFPVGYDGPAPPPNPPNRLIVTPARAVFL